MTDLKKVRNLALIGFMGTGKSSVGRWVAPRIGFEFVDTDDRIEGKARKAISEIFAEEGEAVFRDLEKRVVAELEARSGLVIATGGGLPVDPENLASLRQHALVCCLWAGPDTIWERIRHQTHRPLLDRPDPRETIQQLLKARIPHYKQADVLINTEQRQIQEVAQQVLYQFRLACHRADPSIPDR